MKGSRTIKEYDGKDLNDSLCEELDLPERRRPLKTLLLSLFKTIEILWFKLRFKNLKLSI